ncbi:MAG: aa3-type cytochrome c oxidase subunit IV [Hyphomicrobiaceae bacterium]
MSVDTSNGNRNMDYAEHERTYRGFMQLTKIVVVAISLLLIVMALTLV